MQRRWAVVAITFAGCASGSSSLSQGDAASVDGPRPDAFEGHADDGMSVEHDAAVGMIDARPDAQPIDAAVLPPDACMPTQNEKLVNPAFDSTPAGTGWTEVRIDPTLDIVTDVGVEQSAPYAAYLGGVAGEDFDPPRATITDVIYQRITFPADTTAVVLTGQYYVSTEEVTTGVYDQASVALVDAATDAPIETAFSVNDNQATSAYTPFTKTFTANLAGRTVKLRLTSSHDSTDRTAFLFDTFSLKATHCP